MIRALRLAALTFLSLVASSACKTPPSDEGQAVSKSDADASSVPKVEQEDCRDNSTCGPGEYCTYAPGLCGRGKKAGKCRRKPRNCQQSYAPVCGCDGNVYESECTAHTAGVDLAAFGGCRAQVANWASCGSRYCDALTTYCEIYLSDVFEPPTDYACRPLPSACLPGAGGQRECDCFPRDTECLSFCGHIVTGGVTGFHLTCQGKKPPRSR